MPRLLVFSDLDGTLLDHTTYSYAPARPALAALRARDALLILASSKTAAEMLPLHQELDLGEAPMIVENGAACLTPTEIDGRDTVYRKLRALLSSLDAPFTGFGDMSVDEVATLTGLPRPAAARAKARQFSEPGLWQGDADQKAQFIAKLAQAGITARQGGRFLTLSYGASKADQMQHICRQNAPCFTIALGDAPNDAEMIATADRGVLVRNDHGPDLADFPIETRILRTDLPGPEGWCAAILHLLCDWDQYQKGAAPHG
ncbi:HAD-IIB family hydrolase [Tritonibacter mobilis]|uniref:HAD-IIB family hydrolase n=1 Tax=Tritonibacter mobilis TaxID=379347 RepID=UPI0014457BF4|nr:HAD-IIB family hydrolase [Rhodobacteraceae bacterium R_SAG5]